MKEYTNEQYLKYDPFEGDRDTDVKCRSAKIVKLRRPAMCFGNGETPNHFLGKGSLARSEKAIIDGSWHRCVVCLPCIALWFDEIEAFQ